jgi:hypothetical protein
MGINALYFVIVGVFPSTSLGKSNFALSNFFSLLAHVEEVLNCNWSKPIPPCIGL